MAINIYFQQGHNVDFAGAIQEENLLEVQCFLLSSGLFVPSKEFRNGVGSPRRLTPLLPWQVTDCEPVEVIDMDLKEYGKRGQTGAGLVKHSDRFANAAEASRHLGCKFNEVGLQLLIARMFAKTDVTVRGVTFRLIQDARD